MNEEQQDIGSRIIEVVTALEKLRTQRSARSSSLMKWVVSMAKSMNEAFDDYVGKEVQEMKETISLLSSVNQDINDELGEVRKIDTQYKQLKSQLIGIIDSAERNKIKKIDFSQPKQKPLYYEAATEEPRPMDADELDIAVILDAFSMVADVESLRSRVDRAAKNYSKGINDVESLVEYLMKKKEA